MNNVELKVLEVKKPEVMFNVKEIENYLDEVLSEYNGLVFTEETVKECKKTVTELNKMIKSVDAFRLKYKKELSEPIALFEKQCKDLCLKIENIQEPIKSQADNFEIARKMIKKIEIEELIENTKLTFPELEEKWLNKIIIKEEWLNSSLSTVKLKSSVIDEFYKAKQLQDEYYSKKDLINTKCELQSLKLGLNVQMIPDNFYHMIESKTSTEIENEIIKISELTKQKELEAIENIERKAKEKADAEAKEIIRLSELEKQKEIESIKNETVETIQEISKVVEVLIPVESDVKEKVYTFKLELKATKTQKDALKNYMETIGIEFKQV